MNSFIKNFSFYVFPGVVCLFKLICNFLCFFLHLCAHKLNSFLSRTHPADSIDPGGDTKSNIPGGDFRFITPGGIQEFLYADSVSLVENLKACFDNYSIAAGQ